MKNPFITILDFALLPIILGLIYAIAYAYRNRKYPPGHPWRKYFIPGLNVKILGAIFIGLIYKFYYGNGDTFSYFQHGQIINESMSDSFAKWINLLFHTADKNDPAYYEYISRLYWYKDPASYTTASFSAFFSLFTFNTYLPTAVLFACLSFTGVWMLFRTFASMYPTMLRPIAISVLFIPSTFVWGSGIFKDTICMFALGWLTYSTLRLIVQRDFTVKNIVTVAISFFLLARIKLYILLAFLPALIIWILFLYTRRIRGTAQRLSVTFFVIAALAIGFFFAMQSLGSEALGRYSLDNISSTSAVTRGWISYASGDEGSSYDLGAFSPTPVGMLSKFPAAVVVTFFRPFVWEANKSIVFLSAIEALVFIWLVVRVVTSVKPGKIIQTVSKDPTLQFCLIFFLIFGFAVGISSYNFGALSRYKIPCLPFFALFFTIVFYKNQPASKKLLPFI